MLYPDIENDIFSQEDPASEEETYNECAHFLPLIPELVQAEIEDSAHTIGSALEEFYPHLVEVRDHINKCTSCDKDAFCRKYYEEVQEIDLEQESMDDFVPA